MDNYKNIDELFRDKAYNLKVTPSEKVWKNIDSEYFGASSFGKKKARYWILASLLLFIGITGAWLILSNTNTDMGGEVVTNNSIQLPKVQIPVDQEITQKSKLKNAEKDLNLTSSSLKPEQVNSNLVVSENTPVQFSHNETSNKMIVDYSIVDDIENINSSSFIITNLLNKKQINKITNDISPEIIESNDIITIEEYIERRKKIHMYTGASASFAMAYYPTTTDQSTWSSDFVYGIKLASFYIESGIGFQQMKEQGVFQIGYRTNDSIGYYNKVTSFEINPNNPSEITYKTQTTTVYDSIDHLQLQSPIYKYDYLVIPIKFGYKFLDRPQFSVSAETGLIYSRLIKTYTPKVNYEDPESQLIGILNNTPNRIEHNLRIHVALRLNYLISKTVSFSAQPEFTSYLNSIYTKQSSTTKVKPYTMGIRFGIYFDF